MKNKINSKRIWSSILCGLLIVNTNIVASANNGEDVGEKLRNQYEQTQEKDNVDVEKIQQQNELSKKYKEIEQGMLREQCQTGKIYDNNYGGAYIDDDILVVCITEEKIEEYSDEKVEYKMVDYSYNDLLDVQYKLEETYANLYDVYNREEKEFKLLDSITGIGIDEINNRVTVDIVGLTDDKEIIFQELFGSYSCVKLADVKEKIEEYDTYKAGRGIFVITGLDETYMYTSRLSIGYRAYTEINGETMYGFVSCAHGIQDSINGIVYSDLEDMTEIGEIMITRYDGSFDVSFVQLINNNKMSLMVNYSDSSGTETNADVIKKGSLVSSIPSGYYVYKVGSTTYRTIGNIISTNYSSTVGGIKCTNMIKTTAMAESGDSGGLLYFKDDKYNIILGIVRGGSSSRTLYTKASAIASSMKIYPY